MDVIIGSICALAVAFGGGLALDRVRGVSKRAEGRMARALQGIPDICDRERWQEELRRALLEYEGRPLKQYRESKELISTARELVQIYAPAEASPLPLGGEEQSTGESQPAIPAPIDDAGYRMPLPTKTELLGMIENLSYRERRILELIYGLGGQRPRTLDRVGLTFNVTTETVEQIERQALKKIWMLVEAEKLRKAA